ncbi:MAG TPA: OmpA family protein [Gallionella sp.]|nr:OmpA family protein [Gallionella sp.]
MNNHPYRNSGTRNALWGFLAVSACALLPAQVMAHNETRTQGYLVDSRGELVMSGAGLCWRTGYWTPEMAIEECDPLLVKGAAEPAQEAIPATHPELIRFCTTLDIQFEIDRYAIEHEYEASVERLGAYLRRYPDTTAVIEGHTDEVGTEEYNMQLSQRRANSVMEYLVTHSGIAPSRLKAVGYGKTRPIADNRTEEGKRQNRRIDSVIECAMDLKEGFKPIPGRITMAALDMEFDRNRTGIKPRYRDELARVADFLKENPGATATIEGHSGKTEDPELSRRRAESVVDYLADEFGIARDRLSVAGFGHTRRTAYDWSAEGRRENRRVNIYLDYAK